MEGSIQELTLDTSSNQPSVPSQNTATWSAQDQKSNSVVQYQASNSFEKASSDGRANAREGWKDEKERVKGSGSGESPASE